MFLAMLVPWIYGWRCRSSIPSDPFVKKHLNNWMDVIHVCQRINPCDFGDPLTFFSSTTSLVRFTFFSAMSQQNTQAFMVPRG